MYDKPFISVIVPVFRVEAYINACLASVAAQDYAGRVECLLVDDCGGDRSMDLAREFIGAYSGDIAFRILQHEANRGLSAARNTGMDAAEGEYLFFLDSDDELPADALTKLAKTIEEARRDVVAGSFRIVGKELDLQPKMPDGTVLEGEAVLRSYSERQWPVTACNKLYRTAFLRDNGLRFKEGILHEDELWSFQIALTCRSMVISRHETYIYKIREGSITTTVASERRVSSILTILSSIQAFSKERYMQHNVLVHNKIERFRMNLFRELENDRERFRATYEELRRMMDKPWADALRANGLHLKRQMRDLHLALPPAAGAEYLYLWLTLEKRLGLRTRRKTLSR